MEFTFTIGLWAVLGLIVGSVIFAVATQLVGDAHSGYEWLLTAIGTGIGAFVASEFIVGFRTWEPVFDGLALVPAVIGGVIVGAVVALVTRLLTAQTAGAASVS